MTATTAPDHSTDDRPDGPDGSAYDAVLLAGFGGPEAPDEVMPFLRTVTRGRGVPDERLEEVSHHYLALGGVSPINQHNRELRAALETELRGRGIALPVLWGNRNSAPWLADVVRTAQESGYRRLLGLATSAYSSYSSCRQYREDFGNALLADGLVGTVRIDKVRPYHDRAGFVAPFVDGTVAAVRAATAGGLATDQLEILFTTHSIPTAMADTSGSAVLGDHGPGGAYVAQHRAVAEAVIAAVARELGAAPAWRLVYQSRSGSPAVPWLEPDICDVIGEVGQEWRSGVIVVPIGFVSDHVEVIWDLDNEASQAAQQAGLAFWRVATPGTDPRFVSALVDLIAERVGLAAAPPAVLSGPVRPDSCAPGCCVNLRAPKPTTAGQDSAADWAAAGAAGPDAAALAGSGIGSAGR